jgi:tetratricopeptide (TPR) repeat protein
MFEIAKAKVARPGDHNSAMSGWRSYRRKVNRGVSVPSDESKLEEAVAAYRQAIDIKPDLAYSNLGNALEDQGKHDEAIAAYRHAIDIHLYYAEALPTCCSA